jgi:hypothetical protein
MIHFIFLNESKKVVKDNLFNNFVELENDLTLIKNNN